MATRLVECRHIHYCSSKMSSKCNGCKNNTMRNADVDFYEEANDNPIPDECPRLTYSGTAEQTVGYQCPVCRAFTNPYALDEDRRCKGCGYKLNVG